MLSALQCRYLLDGGSAPVPPPALLLLLLGPGHRLRGVHHHHPRLAARTHQRRSRRRRQQPLSPRRPRAQQVLHCDLLRSVQENPHVLTCTVATYCPSRSQSPETKPYEITMHDRMRNAVPRKIEHTVLCFGQLKLRHIGEQTLN